VPDGEASVALRLTMTPTEEVRLEDYRLAVSQLLAKARTPTAFPDVEALHRSLQSCPDTTDRALMDQVCKAVLGDPPEFANEGVAGWKRSTLQMAQAMLTRQRFDEARLWCVVRNLRLPSEADPLLMHAWCLEEMWTSLLESSGPDVRPGARVRVPTSQGWELVDVLEHAAGLQAALRAHIRRAMELTRDLPGPTYGGLAASLARSGDLEAAREVGRLGVRLGRWTTEFQRPAHFVRGLLPSQAWHDAAAFELCGALEQAAPDIKTELERYLAEGHTLPSVGVRSTEALQVERGSWRELPLFAKGRMDHEVCSKFPETLRVLTESCADATGLAFCGGGEVAFRFLTAGTRLRPHCSLTNVRLTCQLGVCVPLGADPGVSVGGEPPRPWLEGRCSVFDDSFEHFEELDEMAEGDLAVLTLHFWHPAFEHKNDPDWKVKSLQGDASVAVA